MNDGALLRRYCELGDELSFLELCQRHAGLVYSTAARRTGNLEAGRDVSQAVFLLLVRKASRLVDSSDLAGWLHRAACLKAREYLRSERRRHFHEQEAAMMKETQAPGPDPWKELASHIDEHLDRLGRAERELILWRYYSRLSWQTISERLEISEDAARMRLKRALEKLRRKLALGSGLSPTALGGLLEVNAVGAVPEGLAEECGRGAQAGVMPEGTGWGWRDCFAKSGGTIAANRWIAGTACGLAGLVGVGILLWPQIDSLLTSSNFNGHLLRARAPQAERVWPSPVAASVPPAGSGSDAAELGPLLERLRSILFSEVEDGAAPSGDLRAVLVELIHAPDAAYALLHETVADPGAPDRARVRALWGFWLVGEVAPRYLPQIAARCFAVIESPEENNLWWEAAQVLQHLVYPEDSIRRMGEALWRNPAAAYAVMLFMEGAARREPELTASIVRPWLAGDDPLRFCAAAILARLPAEDPAGLMPIIESGLTNSLQQDAAFKALEKLGPAAQSAAPLLLDLLAQTQAHGPEYFRERLARVLASIAPETRNEMPEVEALLLRKETEAEYRQLVEGEPNLPNLIKALDHPSTAWISALELQDLGPAAADALPALRAALELGDLSDFRGYFADAIKEIDPWSPKPLFSRDDLVNTLRALREVLHEVEASISPDEWHHVDAFIRGAKNQTPSDLLIFASELRLIHPNLEASFRATLLQEDSALATYFAENSHPAPPIVHRPHPTPAP